MAREKYLTLGLIIAVLASGLLGGSNAAAQEPKRLALVVGVAAYKHLIPLKNPLNDARLVAQTLRSLGFEVIDRMDPVSDTLRAAVAEITARARGEKADVVLYLAGHGLQIDGTNYFVPADAAVETKKDVFDTSLDITAVLEALASQDGEAAVILDACSNNPFLDQRSIGQGRGLAAVDVDAISRKVSDPRSVFGVGNLLLGLASAPGEVADDGDGANSPYAKALASSFTNAKDLSDAIHNARRSVYLETNRVQLPYIVSSQRRGIRLR